MIKRIGGLAIAGWMALAGAAQAESPVVVELFTSQGCSSCPPADRILAELSGEEDVIALALHVDYWDYLGWKDLFADPAHTERQRAYARAQGERTIYTPQMIVGGVDHVVGSKAMKISKLVRKHMAVDHPVAIRLDRSGDTVRVRATAEGRMPLCDVLLVTYEPEATVAIKRGENAGRTITYANVVRGILSLGSWDGQGEFTASARVAEDMPVVVLVQPPGAAGPIMGASRLR